MNYDADCAARYPIFSGIHLDDGGESKKNQSFHRNVMTTDAIKACIYLSNFSKSLRIFALVKVVLASRVG